MLGARPEHLFLAEEGDLRGSVFGIEYMGSRQVVTIDTDVGRVRVRAPKSARAAVGETVGVGFRSRELVVFDRAGGRALDSELFGDAPHG